jgi:hypothetical protein
MEKGNDNVRVWMDFFNRLFSNFSIGPYNSQTGHEPVLKPDVRENHIFLNN